MFPLKLILLLNNVFNSGINYQLFEIYIFTLIQLNIYMHPIKTHETSISHD